MTKMKKPMLAALGLAGACAACCALPVALSMALPLVGGLSVAGAVGWFSGLGWLHPGVAVAGAAVIALALAGTGVWRRRRAGARCATPDVAQACTIGATGGCGCQEAARKAQGA